MSYHQEREEFIIRVIKEGLGYDAAKRLLREATKINRLAELACSSEAADRDRVPCPGIKGKSPCLCDWPGWTVHDPGVHSDIPRIRLQDHRAGQRAVAAVPAGWSVLTAGDPRGYTLRVIPPSYAERNAGRDRFNLDSIGVPARESGLRF